MGRHRTRQPTLHQRGDVDFAHRRAVARPAAELWGLEEHPASVLPVAGQGGVGALAGDAHCGAGLRMAHD